MPGHLPEQLPPDISRREGAPAQLPAGYPAAQPQVPAQLDFQSASTEPSRTWQVWRSSSMVWPPASHSAAGVPGTQWSAAPGVAGADFSWRDAMARSSEGAGLRASPAAPFVPATVEQPRLLSAPPPPPMPPQLLLPTVAQPASRASDSRAAHFAPDLPGRGAVEAGKGGFNVAVERFGLADAAEPRHGDGGFGVADTRGLHSGNGGFATAGCGEYLGGRDAEPDC